MSPQTFVAVVAVVVCIFFCGEVGVGGGPQRVRLIKQLCQYSPRGLICTRWVRYDIYISRGILIMNSFCRTHFQWQGRPCSVTSAQTWERPRGDLPGLEIQRTLPI